MLSPTLFFFFIDTATTAIYTLSLHDALPISFCGSFKPLTLNEAYGFVKLALIMASINQFPAEPAGDGVQAGLYQDRKSTRLNSSHITISYAVFCLKKKNINRHV